MTKLQLRYVSAYMKASDGNNHVHTVVRTQNRHMVIACMWAWSADSLRIDRRISTTIKLMLIRCSVLLQRVTRE